MGGWKRFIKLNSQSLGLYICGGKGKFSRETPSELIQIAEKTGLNGNELVRASKLSAKVDNTAIQDGYQLYLHNFILSDNGNWSVIQQGMHDSDGTARRYHCHSENITSFVEEPHTGINGISRGRILNLTDSEAAGNRKGILDISHTDSIDVMKDFSRLILPAHHDVQASDVDLKRLGALLYITREQHPQNFEDLLMLEGVGPRTMQSLALVSEVIHGAPSRFTDPARFSFAHGGKDGHPFPVPTKVYDESISILRKGIEKSKLGNSDKQNTLNKLHQIVTKAEKDFTPDFDIRDIIEEERQNSWRFGGKTVMGDAQKPSSPKPIQLSLF